MIQYRTRINIGAATLGSTEDILDLARQHGAAYIEYSDLVVTYDVGESDGILDLWDLREVMEEFVANLSSYCDCTFEKPTPVSA
jgi:hypothetical protein